MIKKERIDLSEERRILTNMIVSTPFLNGIIEIADPQLFESSFSKTISQWVVEYFQFTSEAPGKAIQDIFLEKADRINDEDELDLIEEYLSRLSRDWEKNQVNNIKYNQKNAVNFFKLRSLEQLKNKIGNAVLSKNAPQGEKLVKEYQRVEKKSGSGVDLFNDPTAISHAYLDKDEHLFSLPGKLGQAVGPFVRGDFIAYMGPAKRGKTWWLWFSGYRAACMGLNCLFISLEMTMNRMIRRSWNSILGRPVTTTNIKTPKFVQDNDKYLIDWEDRKIKGIDTEVDKIAEQQKQLKMYMKGGSVRIETFPTDAASIEDIKTLLKNLEFYEGFIPDVLVIDYADLLITGQNMETRHELNKIWRGLRGLAQSENIGVITASQAGRATMERDVKSGDVSEDYRKLTHVTKMMSLNQSDTERNDGVMRIRTVVQREGATFSSQVVVLQSLEIGRPYMDSQFIDDIVFEEKEKK